MPTSAPPQKLSQPPARQPLASRPNGESRNTQAENFQEEIEPEPHGRRRQTFSTPSTRYASPPPLPPLAPLSPPYPHITTTKPLAPPPPRRNHRSILSTVLSKRKRHTILHPHTDHNRKTSGHRQLQQQNNAKVTQQCLSPNKGLSRAKGQGIHPPSSTSSKNLLNRVAASPDKENLPPEDEKLLLRGYNNSDEGAVDAMHKDVGGAAGCSHSAPVSCSTCRGCSHSYCDCDCNYDYDYNYYYDYDHCYCYPADLRGDSLPTQVVSTPSPSRTTIPSDEIWWWNDTDIEMRANPTRGSTGLTTKARVYTRQQPPQQEQQEQGQTSTSTSQGLVVRRPLNHGAEDPRKARSGSLLAPPPPPPSSSTAPRKSFPSAETNTRSRLFEGTISSRSKMVGAPPAVTAATRATAGPQAQQEPRRASGINPTPPRRVRWTSKFENLRAQSNREQPHPQLQQTGTKRESTGLRAAPAPAPAIGSRRETFRRNSQLAPPVAAPAPAIGSRRESFRRNSQLAPPVAAPAAPPRLPSSSIVPKREPLRRGSQLAPPPPPPPAAAAAPSQLPSSSPLRLRVTRAQKEDSSGSGSGNGPGSIRAGPPAPTAARQPARPLPAPTTRRKPTVTITQPPQQPQPQPQPRRITLHRAPEDPQKQLLTPAPAAATSTTSTTTPRRSFTHTRIASLPSLVKSLNRPKLIADPKSFAQVWEARPPAYWLGRFVTLTNAFHYEDSFRQPDAATGSPEMLSSYPQRPLAGTGAGGGGGGAATAVGVDADADADDEDLPDSRVKRAFTVLENVCVTDEASGSFRRFRDAYVVRFGDRWMD